MIIPNYRPQALDKKVIHPFEDLDVYKLAREFTLTLKQNQTKQTKQTK